MKNGKFLLLGIFIINIVFLSFNIYYYNKTSSASLNLSKDNSTNKQLDDKYSKKIVLEDLMNYLNQSADTSLMSKKFGLIKVASDPLYEIPYYEESDKTNDAVLSVSYGIEGIYKIDKNASLKITIIKDNTLKNGNYIFTKSEQSFESSYYKIKDTFLIFEALIDSKLDNDEITNSMINVIQFKQRFYNQYNNYLTTLSS